MTRMLTGVSTSDLHALLAEDEATRNFRAGVPHAAPRVCCLRAQVPVTAEGVPCLLPCSGAAMRHMGQGLLLPHEHVWHADQAQKEGNECARALCRYQQPTTGKPGMAFHGQPSRCVQHLPQNAGSAGLQSCMRVCVCTYAVLMGLSLTDFADGVELMGRILYSWG